MYPTTVTATELARNLREILNAVEFGSATVAVVRNKRVIATISPRPPLMTAEKALAGVWGLVGEDAGKDWGKDARSGESLDVGLRDSWAS